MSTILVLIVSVFLGFTNILESFEGRIKYHVFYESRIPNVSNDQLSQMLGSEQEFYYKSGNYKSIVNGTSMDYLTYLVDSNKLYMKMPNMDILMSIDAEKNSDEILSTQVKRNADTVLGFVCDELIIKGKNSLQKFYYNSKFSVNPNESEKHKASNWASFISISKALPLKMIVETEQFVSVTEAFEYKKEPVSASIFKLDPSLKITKGQF